MALRELELSFRQKASSMYTASDFSLLRLKLRVGIHSEPDKQHAR